MTEVNVSAPINGFSEIEHFIIPLLISLGHFRDLYLIKEPLYLQVHRHQFFWGCLLPNICDELTRQLIDLKGNNSTASTPS